MLSVILWRCDCGAGLKATYKPSQIATAVRCPTPSCKTKHIIVGNVQDIHRQTGADTWEHVNCEIWFVQEESHGKKT